MAWNTWITVRGEKKVNPAEYMYSPDARDPALVGPASANA
jgi:cytochrome c oxidase cbb3-type subunit 1